MTDIVERLRAAAGTGPVRDEIVTALLEAADEIERLRAALRLADAKLNGWLDVDREEEARAAVRAALGY